jgi:hypothetical protein
MLHQVKLFQFVKFKLAEYHDHMGETEKKCKILGPKTLGKSLHHSLELNGNFVLNFLKKWCGLM